MQEECWFWLRVRCLPSVELCRQRALWSWVNYLPEPPPVKWVSLLVLGWLDNAGGVCLVWPLERAQSARAVFPPLAICGAYHHIQRKGSSNFSWGAFQVVCLSGRHQCALEERLGEKSLGQFVCEISVRPSCVSRRIQKSWQEYNNLAKQWGLGWKTRSLKFCSLFEIHL